MYFVQQLPASTAPHTMENNLVIQELQQQLQALQAENAQLRRRFHTPPQGATVQVPAGMEPLFQQAQEQVSAYFSGLKRDPTRGTIEIQEERYVLVRASALSKDFLETIQKLYADRGPAEALAIGKNFLFDIAHVIGMNDARSFQQKMNLTDPLSKLSAGPVHFAHSGWAFVNIHPESSPTPNEDFYLSYSHPYSFEADSWIRSGKQSHTPVCIMNAGYSSGWCEESFGIPLTSVEVTCTAKGDAACHFIMSPPEKIEQHLHHFREGESAFFPPANPYEIPTFFERKKVEEELQRARRMAEEALKAKADFVANISHELRTPLGIILGFTDLLQKTEPSGQQQNYIGAIQAAGRSLLSVINNILDLSRLEEGPFSVACIPFQMATLLHTLGAMFAGQAAEKGLQLHCTTGEEVAPALLGDPDRLTQILTNLVGNAIKFTPAGSIRVSCILEKEDAGRQQLLFTVSDTGIGIPAEKQEAVFQRFTQADPDTTRKYGGTGLGLAITAQLIALQGGTVSLESREDEGATFRFRLSYPIAETAAGALPVAPVLPLPAGSTKKVLVVEDNLMMQRLAQELLQHHGLNVTLAGNGAEAVARLRKEAFDVILMDIQMPVMDGYKATCTIRDELRNNTPIIAMTAHALDKEKDSCIHGGMNDYIAKPFQEAHLIERVHYWLAQTLPAGIVNLNYLKEQSHNNAAFIKEMTGLFKTQTPLHLQTLEAALAANDLQTVFKTAHTLRNTIGFFGLESTVGAALLELEAGSRSGKAIPNALQLAHQVRKVLEQAIAELEQLRMD